MRAENPEILEQIRAEDRTLPMCRHANACAIWVKFGTLRDLHESSGSSAV